MLTEEEQETAEEIEEARPQRSLSSASSGSTPSLSVPHLDEDEESLALTLGNNTQGA